MIHRGEENLACTTFLYFVSPIHESQFLTLASAFGVAVPSISIVAGINGAYYYLRTKVLCYLVDEAGVVDSSRVDTHLVGTSIEQAFHIANLLYATTNGKWYVDFCRHTTDDVSEGFASFIAGSDVQETQFVSTIVTVSLAQFHWITSSAQIDKVGTLHRHTILYIQTGYYSFC